MPQVSCEEQLEGGRGGVLGGWAISGVLPNMS